MKPAPQNHQEVIAILNAALERLLKTSDGLDDGAYLAARKNAEDTLRHARQWL